MEIRTKLLTSLLAVTVAGLLIGGCGADKQESLTVNLDSFTSPDGNIGCIADETMVRCDIAKPDWKVAPDPKCNLDYGNGLAVADRRGYIVCAGDTTMNSGPILPSNRVNMVGPFECVSSEAGDGMRCENMTTGHGFDLSTATFETF